ncbi:MAG: hypothetical protein HZB73_04645 [Nitrosarchaeum sp.]|nr:hypothetical protein [Nitrosarchaeum sp.]
MNNSTLKILVPYPSAHDKKSVITLLFDNLIPLLKEKIDIKILRLVYQSTSIDTSSYENDPVNQVLDIHDYKNAVELVKKEKPDIIYANPYPGFIDFAFSTAGKSLNIPVINLIFQEPGDLPKFALYKSYMTKFFQNSIPSEGDSSKKTAMGRGKFITYKFLFMLKTLAATKMNPLKIAYILILFLKFYLFPPLMDRRLAISIHFLQNEVMKEKLISLGFDQKSLIVTGNPLYDKFFQKTLTKEPSKNRLVRILFAPDTLYEFGEWTKEQRNSAIENIVKKINKEKNEFDLTVKIHPSATILSDYQAIIHQIDPKIPVYQEGGVQDFLDKIDVLISFTSSSSSVVYSMLAVVPIIICNFVDLGKREKFLEKGLAYECRTPDELVPLIKKAINENPTTKEKRDQYVKEFLYRDDGKAAQR